MIAVGNQNKKIQDKYKWNHFNNMPMKSLLGANHRLPLSHMTKRFIWIEETQEGNNEILIGYMINPELNINTV